MNIEIRLFIKSKGFYKRDNIYKIKEDFIKEIIYKWNTYKQKFIYKWNIYKQEICLSGILYEGKSL